MKRPKLLFKVDHNNRGKLYINNKWIPDVTEINIHGEPRNYSVVIERYKRDSDGRVVIKYDECERYITEYHIRSKSL